MAYLLDTVTISEFRDKQTRAPSVIAWQATLGDAPVFLSVISLNEIRYGIHKVRQSDQSFADLLENWYTKIVADQSLLPFLPVNRQIAEHAAELRFERKMSHNDSLIAATAAVHNLTLATRNTADFKSTGIKLVNPWGFESERRKS